MTILLVMGTIYTVVGGMLSVLVTDFLQFIVMSGGLIAVTILILVKIGWGRLAETVTERYADGGFNPLANPQLGWQSVLFYAFLNVADDNLASLGSQRCKDRPPNLHPHQLLLCLPLVDSRYLGNRRTICARPPRTRRTAVSFPG